MIPNPLNDKPVATATVRRTSEFERISRLPRRVWAEAPDLAQVTLEATAALKTPGGTMTLWPVQAAALRDLYEVKGLLAPLACGGGKALISLLAPVVLDSKRPILFVPASLRDQTILKVIPEMRKHWKLHRSLMVIGYEELSLARNAEMLERLRPDLIISDEAHNLAHVDAGRTRRVVRYMRENPGTIYVTMSGTITRRSLRDYGHLAHWALKDDLCPMPTKFMELGDWADIIDEKPPESRKVNPGVLREFCGTTIDAATGFPRPENIREGFSRRLNESVGVIASSENELGVSLEIQERKLEPDPRIAGLIQEMRDTWQTPSGDEITDPLTLWRHARCLCAGFYYRFDPRPPDDWLDARRQWRIYVRETISGNRRGLDTPLQARQEMEAFVEGREWKTRPSKHYADAGRDAFLEWTKIGPTFKPNSIPVWVSNFLIEDAADWLSNNDGVAWVEFDAVGNALATRANKVYYGGGKSASRAILDASGSIVASIKAHGTGKNMQAWSKALLTSQPPAGLTMEQVLARLHRPGQKADTVVFETYLFAEELRASFRRALSDAHYVEDSTGAKQKLTSYANIGFKV